MNPEETEKLLPELQKEQEQIKKKPAYEWFTRQIIDGIWLKVSNIRLEADELFLRFEADKGDVPTWWKLDAAAAGKEAVSTYRTIQDALDKKKVVLGKLECDQGNLNCKIIRIQFAE